LKADAMARGRDRLAATAGLNDAVYDAIVAGAYGSTRIRPVPDRISPMTAASWPVDRSAE
jgi:hypothetical protein